MSKKLRNRIGIGITICVALMLVFSYQAKAELSFWDKVAGLYTQLLYDDTKDEVIDQIGDGTSLSAMPGSELYTEHFCVNDVCSIYKNGDFINASTTIFAFKNPFSATSSISDIKLTITGGASTTRQFIVGTSTYAGVDTVATVPFGCTAATPIVCGSAPVTGFSLGTSTKGTMVVNGDSHYWDGGFGQGFNHTATSDDFIVGPTEYIVGYSTTTAQCGIAPSTAGTCTSVEDGLVNSDNVFKGKYLIKVDRIK